jgi:hypothetical protein
MKRPFPRRAPLKLAFIVTMVLALGFALRLAIGVLYWDANQARTIEAWMPIGYVARSWEIPPNILAEALGVEPGALPRESLERIAAQQNLPVSEVIARLEAAIIGYQGARP